ncbi:hypothetical protein YPPY66_4451 [Yersinia pestis PY-66]|uniref:Uncharacterized protein n=1 Tax=Yersinia pestis biovar Orientalis str. IP275 TaxID=373665 RepID=A0AAV3BBA9_YERPE|nr:hypothetical protein YPC_4392 [Yersinia pestis biovar Medievalis str. Harbin 35]EDR33183.1 hypothetical protein YPIP275_0196 [Yersinia pestis biovar Orientalis str. IP275]EDR41374.1 hypothetical protein YpE1979001_4466 [Yersinia pestis biovar Antiqua str. E1979001]EDR49113.1 hypothetical protein YpB42003004_0534 [Yersinia pestis biovar Antiqua str. B42003004]EDR65269.1 hypothetical protein YpK1973002_3071 [Yersinia pestis biovar Mediaevalis str. K1973002]EEO74437.1 hypothetical protein YP51
MQVINIVANGSYDAVLCRYGACLRHSAPSAGQNTGNFLSQITTLLT